MFFDNRGDQFSELGLILALVVVVAIGALSTLGANIRAKILEAAAAL